MLMQLLKPKNHNNIQRAGFFFSVAAMVTVFFLHFPFDGYNIDKCPSGGWNCNDSERVLRSFWDWYSPGAILNWFGNMTHFMVTLTFIASIGLLWLYVFKDKEETTP
ncbi:hypothetical protein Q670_03690 [Alcanivorax sp. P2S70]|uniref:hypothetical protein n=1 Tax=Alcanivorax sp. P2S70 TaxID=1397527 RepID=UPI0003B4E44C|nr:hypothetical protein [Alcanivorax sp. P2S70]ERP89501.1 hypothetical protein Q670_03690 [Alcanivorax sp. P2S70]